MALVDTEKNATSASATFTAVEKASLCDLIVISDTEQMEAKEQEETTKCKELFLLGT